MNAATLLAGAQALRILAEAVQTARGQDMTAEQKAAAWDAMVDRVERAESAWEDSKAVAAEMRGEGNS